MLLYVLLTGQSFDDDSYYHHHHDHQLSMSDITDIDDVILSATGLHSTFPDDVIDDVDLSSPRDSLSCDLSRYIQCNPVVNASLISSDSFHALFHHRLSLSTFT